MKQFAGNESWGGVSYDGDWAPGPLPPGGSSTGGTSTGGTCVDVRAMVVAYAESIAGLAGGGSTYLAYVSVVATGENLQTQQSMATMSSCGLAVSGIWTACGYYGAGLNVPYDYDAVSRLITIGQNAGAYVTYTAGALPNPGDMVFIGSNTPETHVYTVISVGPTSGGVTVIQSVDGGQPWSGGS